MAEEKQKQEEKKQKPKQEKKELKEEKKPMKEERYESLVRIFGYDIPGTKNIYAGLTRIKGISWSISNAACIKLGMPRNKRIQDLSKDEIKKIENFLKNLEVLPFMKNRRFDPETGKTSHLYGSDLDIREEFDIKRLKQMKSYIGIRHGANQPVRGQRTRSHFRKKKVAIVGKKAIKQPIKSTGK
ncbi:30S ribosomal protein S13 [Candidatus Pacearchaeota archaeon]|nr:30S ribosomal protein S13 [Candidatus Pacearchaeota archaeon]